MGAGHHNKDKGVSAELAVAAELSRRGFGVAWPVGDYARYDLIATAPESGKLTRIQVKTGNLTKHGTYRIGFHRGSAKKVKYTTDDCDAFIVWLPFDSDYKDQYAPAFYIMPLKGLDIVKATFYPPGKGRHPTWVCANEKYRDNWDSIK